jgi:nucleoid-associated protein YgaU
MRRIVLYGIIIAVHIFLISIFIFSGDSSTSEEPSSTQTPSKNSDEKKVNDNRITQDNDKNKDKESVAEDKTIETEQYYTVKPGDSLMKISKKFYGTSKYYKFIYESNRDVLKSLSSIKVGQDLVIPPKPE